jgi:hypothetical protein
MADSRNTNSTAEQPAKGRTTTPSNVPQAAKPGSGGGPSRDEVSRRAYELYQKRGGAHGRHNEDWLEAEQQLREERQRAAGNALADPVAKKSAAKKSAAKKSAAKKSAAKKSAAKTVAAKKSVSKATGGLDETGGKG